MYKKHTKILYPHKIIEYIFLLVLLTLTVSYCSKDKLKTLDVLGSDTMVQLAQRIGVNYIKDYPKENISIQGGGSGRGIAALINGLSHIATSSRKIKPKEITIAKEKNIEIIERVAAYDGIAIIVNKNNPVSKLTLQEISDIYTNKITNWKQLKGLDQNIVSIARENNSGTYEYFKQKVIRLGNKKSKKSYGKSVVYGVASQQIVQQVINNVQAIGFLGMGWISPSIKVIAVAKDVNSTFYLPNYKNIMDGKYPIFRELYLYTTKKQLSKAQPLLDYIVSEKGKSIVKDLGFVALK